jgi:hypothetical protein
MLKWGGKQLNESTELNHPTNLYSSCTPAQRLARGQLTPLNKAVLEEKNPSVETRDITALLSKAWNEILQVFRPSILILRGAPAGDSGAQRDQVCLGAVF